MSFINHLIKRAKAEPPPSELVIPPNRLGTLIDHILATTFVRRDAGLVRQNLLDGKVRLLGVPLRVIRQ
jgi:hypothetical protein